MVGNERTWKSQYIFDIVFDIELHLNYFLGIGVFRKFPITIYFASDPFQFLLLKWN